MKLFIFLPHTGDIKFQAYGRTLEEAFINAAYALTEIITPRSKIKAKIQKKVMVSSEDQKSLLYDFLESFLFWLDTENFLLKEIKKLEIKGNKLEAKLTGDNQIKNYEIKTVAKAVTYQEMFIKKEKKKYIIQVVVDI